MGEGFLETVKSYIDQKVYSCEKIVKELKDPLAMQKLSQLFIRIIDAIDYATDSKHYPEMVGYFKKTNELIGFYKTFTSILTFINPFSSEKIDQKLFIEMIKNEYGDSFSETIDLNDIIDRICKQELKTKAQVRIVLSNELSLKGLDLSKISDIEIPRLRRSGLETFMILCGTLTSLKGNIRTLENWKWINVGETAKTIASKVKHLRFLKTTTRTLDEAACVIACLGISAKVLWMFYSSFVTDLKIHESYWKGKEVRYRSFLPPCLNFMAVQATLHDRLLKPKNTKALFVANELADSLPFLRKMGIPF